MEFPGQRAHFRHSTPYTLGRCFWPLSAEEKVAITALFERKAISYLVTSLSRRDENTKVNVIDAAYWLKGCSSLGKLRYAVLLNVGSSEPRIRIYA